MNVDLIIILPEIILLALACLVLMVDAFSKDPLHLLTYWTTQASLLVVMALVLFYFPYKAQVAFNGEGEFRQIGKAAEIVGMHPRCLETLAIERHLVIGMAKRPFQALEL